MIPKRIYQTWKTKDLPWGIKKVIKNMMDLNPSYSHYLYDDNDNTHYEYFDYIDAKGKIQLYEPDSDMDFMKFKQLMKEEWSKINKK